MNTIIRHTSLALIAAVSLATVTATARAANQQGNLQTQAGNQPQTKLIYPGGNNGGYNPYLPKFGFNSFNIGGVGDRITYVQWGGLAARLGLEPGDTLLSLNGFPLTYHGAWNNALNTAMQNGGFVTLNVRDVRTGWVIQRQLNLGYNGGPVGPIGPITPKAQLTQNGPITSQAIVGNQGPAAPDTTKKVVQPQNNNGNNQSTEVAKLSTN